MLTYADLRALYRGVDGRTPSREIILHFTGNMERYIWGVDGRKLSQAEPIHLELGERVRFVLINSPTFSMIYPQPSPRGSTLQG
jgi:FtsP/CotA-like multicopper oxidase with cupredoxin domain